MHTYDLEFGDDIQEITSNEMPEKSGKASGMSSIRKQR